MDKHSLSRGLVVINLLNLALLFVLLIAGLIAPTIILIMLLSTGLIVVVTITRFNRYFSRISEIARKVSNGEYGLRIPDLETEEFDIMGKSLNQMLGKLDSTIGHLAVHREELRLLLGSLDDVLWSQSYDGRIMWANGAFAGLFATYAPDLNQFFWNVIRDPALMAFINQTSESRERMLQEFVIKDHYYLLIASHNAEADRIVFILQDIDSIRQAEQMKKDFIVNLAHELRTPLTAIKGYSEALQPEVSAESQRFVKIILNHSHRLINLISDLEHLIKLERQADVTLQEIDLFIFLDNIRLVLQPLLDEHGLYLNIEIEPGLMRACLDPFRFEQVFINLVENSIRYTPTGGVSISAKSEGSRLRFSVCDTGSGIEQIHVSRIFERFYVADPSRNRSKSGTGLGLSIVKHIVILHNGSINVSSEPGKGTCFNIDIPGCVTDSEA